MEGLPQKLGAGDTGSGPTSSSRWPPSRARSRCNAAPLQRFGNDHDASRRPRSNEAPTPAPLPAEIQTSRPPDGSPHSRRCADRTPRYGRAESRSPSPDRGRSWPPLPAPPRRLRARPDRRRRSVPHPFLAATVVLVEKLAQRAGMRALQFLHARPAFQQSPHQGAGHVVKPPQNLGEIQLQTIGQAVALPVFSSTVRLVPPPETATGGFPPCPAAVGADVRDDASTDPATRPCRWDRPWPPKAKGFPVARRRSGMDREQHQVCVLGQHVDQVPRDCSKQTAMGRPPKRCCKLPPKLYRLRRVVQFPLLLLLERPGPVARNASGRPSRWPQTRPIPARRCRWQRIRHGADPFWNGLAWLLRKPYSESRTRRLLSIRHWNQAHPAARNTRRKHRVLVADIRSSGMPAQPEVLCLCVER